MTFIGSLVLSALVLAPPAPAGVSLQVHSGIVATLEALEREWFRVYETHDLAVLRRLIAHDFVATLADGTMRGKDAHIAAYPADFETLASVTNSELRVTVFTPDVAVATGLYTAIARGEAGSPKRYRYTDTWLRRNGRWQCVATHENGVH